MYSEVKLFKSSSQKYIGFRMMVNMVVVHLIMIKSAASVTCNWYPPITNVENYVYILLGSPLNVTCSSENGNTENINFGCVDGVEPVKKILNSTSVAYYPKLGVGSRHCNCSSDKTKSCGSTVQVEAPLQNVTDFSCISDNMKSLDCSWIPSPSISFPKHTLVDPFQEELTLCESEARQDGKVHCILDEPKYRPYVTEYIHLKLDYYNKVEHKVQNFSIKHFSTVKLQPPKINVFVIKTDSAVLQWDIEDHIVSRLTCGIEYRIEYTALNATQLRSIEVNAKGLPSMNNTYTFNLTGLEFSHVHYKVRVFLKPKFNENELWSNSTVIFETASEIPRRPPDVPAGAFVSNSYNRKTIYWKQLQNYEECGNEFNYKVYVNQDYKSPIIMPKSSINFVSDNKTEAIEISIQSLNSEGPSINSSHLHIPAQADILPGPSSFTVDTCKNGSQKLLWNIDQSMDINNYTLFWCKYQSNGICADSIDYTVLYSNQTSYIFTLHDKYMFFISANSGHNTSGMTLSECYISTDSDNLNTLKNVLTIDHKYPTEGSVNITWKFRCLLPDGFATGYSLKYCPVFTNKSCNPDVATTEFNITDPNIMEYKVTGLSDGEYYFRIFLWTAKGPIEMHPNEKIIIRIPQKGLEAEIMSIIFVIGTFSITAIVIVAKHYKKKERKRKDISVVTSRGLQDFVDVQPTDKAGDGIGQWSRWVSSLCDRLYPKSVNVAGSESLLTSEVNKETHDTSDVQGNSCQLSTHTTSVDTDTTSTGHGNKGDQRVPVQTNLTSNPSFTPPTPTDTPSKDRDKLKHYSSARPLVNQNVSSTLDLDVANVDFVNEYILTEDGQDSARTRPSSRITMSTNIAAASARRDERCAVNDNSSSGVATQKLLSVVPPSEYVWASQTEFEAQR